MNLTPEEIASYRTEADGMRRLGFSIMLAAVSDVEKLLNEVEASRLRIAQLRESQREASLCKP